MESGARATRLPRTRRFDAAKREADNEIFDRSCDLLEAARAIRHLSTDARATAAVPAVLGCIEASLRDLAEGIGELRRTLPTPGVEQGEAAERARRGLTNLRGALDDAAMASEAARALSARMHAPCEGN
jgi:hypothetical protein